VPSAEANLTHTERSLGSGSQVAKARPNLIGHVSETVNVFCDARIEVVDVGDARRPLFELHVDLRRGGGGNPDR
jgi:hypothetical protein